MRSSFALPLALVACAPPAGSLASAEQAAQELNVDARFGRSEFVMDHVAPDARPDFAMHHRAWGTAIRVADIELTGVRSHGEHEVEVMVRVAWYRPEEQELRVTTLQQGWRDKDKSGWQLVTEQRLEGDVGLLGEPIVFQAPPGDRPSAQFPTVRLSP
jgi:hypothetical protein